MSGIFVVGGEFCGVVCFDTDALACRRSGSIFAVVVVGGGVDCGGVSVCGLWCAHQAYFRP